MNDDTNSRRDTFDRLYSDDPDPWNVDTSSYELQKRQAALDILPNRRFSSVLDIGCGSGVLALQLSNQNGDVVAVDVSRTALKLAADRLKDKANVSFHVLEVPSEWPTGTFDLIVISEVLYFLSESEIIQTSQKAAECLADEGVCLLVNWTGHNDLPVNGEQAAALFRASSRWSTLEHNEDDTFRLDLLSLPQG